MTHERPPEQLSKEIWFYSLERRRQSTFLRRMSVALAVIAGILLFVAPAGAIAALAAVVTLEVVGYLRGQGQKASIVAQLRDGANPQLVDAVGTAFSNRAVVLVALVVAAAAGIASLLVIGQLS